MCQTVDFGTAGFLHVGEFRAKGFFVGFYSIRTSEEGYLLQEFKELLMNFTRQATNVLKPSAYRK